ncbi:glycosyltransferase [Rheinheimera sp. UJ51]|uniref:CgeB family protein n=1 Tax=Rheinheimera sp. UJ51 TaxID=2892446 RepID=UPI001E55C931|nr:glycosyltransferase [Rheinheimera sp. UJ51]MCC5450276.1 glycosyltransferase [Rheinheimera sp. UJ51]
MQKGIKRLTGLFKKQTVATNTPTLPANAMRLLANNVFDANWYATRYLQNKAEKAYQANPLQHFLLIGAKLGLQPAPWFDNAWYLAKNPDVKTAGVNPLLHYLQHGVSEGRERASVLYFDYRQPELQFIRPNDAGITFNLPLFPKARCFNMKLLFQQYRQPLIGKPSGILLVECFDEAGKAIQENVSGLKWSEMFNCWYRYLVQKDVDILHADKFKMGFPAEAVRCQLTIKAWANSAFEVRNRFQLHVEQAEISASTLLPAAGVAKSVQTSANLTADQLTVALIADEFTYNSFKDEFKAVPLEPDTWREQFEANKPDIFFCESAWSGTDSKRRPWKGKIYASVNFARENRSILLEILAYCRQNGIPTLFWNKEDPTHYPDRKHDFVKTATLFDYVFTSAEECVAQYQQDYGLKNVFALPFATNPRLFNPFATAVRSNKVVFAGSWYANHIERSKVMEQILDSLLASGYEPEIYDRYYGDPDPLHIWPEKYLPYIKPGQPHDQMPAVYKSSHIGLNFNTVTESSTMFARRVFELMSSNTLVVSNYAKGVAEMFGDLVVFADQTPQRLAGLTEAERDVIREQALQLVLAEHTYAKRWRYMLNCIGFNVKPDDERVTLVNRITNDTEAMAAISYYEQHFGRNANCRLLLVVSAAVPDIDVAAFYQKYNRFGISVTSESFMQKHALEGKYQPVETPYFVLFTPEQHLTASWLEKARLHLTYLQDYPITVSNGKPYHLEVLESSAILAGRRAQFTDLYYKQASSAQIIAYGV